MIISINPEKNFGKIQHSLMGRTLNSQYKGNIFEDNKAT